MTTSAAAIAREVAANAAETRQNRADTPKPPTAPNTIDPTVGLFFVPVEEPQMASPDRATRWLNRKFMVGKASDRT